MGLAAVNMKKALKSCGLGLGIGNRLKVRVLEKGRILYESPWQPNLILNQGMDALGNGAIVASSNVSNPTVLCDLFLYCAVGTGTSPFFDDSGNVTANVAYDSTNGVYRATASSAFWSSGDVGKLFVPKGINNTGIGSNSGNGPITSFIDSRNVTVGVGAAAASVSGVAFFDYYVTRTGLSNEVNRSNTYQIGAGQCGTFVSNPGSTLLLDPALNSAMQPTTANVIVYNHQRTFVFPPDAGTTYTEVGFSGASGVGGNLNMATLLLSPVTILAGQQLVVIYQVQLAVAPIIPVVFNGSFVA